MIYRSNLVVPDLTPHFKHLTVRPMPHSFGHDVPSDWADKADDDPVFGLYKRCGLWTHDEAAILFHVAHGMPGRWIDIGAHSGWTTAHIASAGSAVLAVDPLLRLQAAQARFEQNMDAFWDRVVAVSHETSNDLFEYQKEKNAPNDKLYEGVCVDGDHQPGKPLEDAIGAEWHLAESGVIMFHDFIGQPVREAVEYLMGRGFKARVYFTPHMVACSWRGDFIPPDHVPDPDLPDLKARCPEFPFERCA